MINFCKELDDFKNLRTEDQVGLIRGASLEIILLYCSTYYDPVQRTIKLGPLTYTDKHLELLGLSEVRFFAYLSVVTSYT